MTDSPLPDFETVEVYVGVADSFTRDDVAGWDVATSGQPWTNTGGSPSDFSVSDGAGKHSVGTLATDRRSTIDAGTVDQDFTVLVNLSALLTGSGNGYVILSARSQDTSNQYEVDVRFTTGATVDFKLSRRRGGSQTTLATNAGALTHVAANWYAIRVQAIGAVVRVKAWNYTQNTRQPDVWTRSATDPDPLLIGTNIALRTTIDNTITNALPLSVSFDDLVVQASRWLDISDRVRTNHAPLEAPAGRQTTLEDIQNSRFAASLDNRDRRFTPGNLTSDLWPFWDQGCPIRWRTTIAGGTVGQFRGVVEMPQDFINLAEVEDDDDAHMHCAVTAVDRLTQLDRAPAFISTLAAHNISVAGSYLRAYYTFDDAGPDFRDAAGQVEPMAPYVKAGGREIGVTTYGAGPSLPGDDLSPVHFELLPEAPPLLAGLGSRPPLVKFGVPLVLSGTDVLTMTMWIRRTVDYAWQQPLSMLYLINTDTGEVTGTLTEVVGIYGNSGPMRFGLGVALNNLAAVTDPVGTLYDGSTDRWFPIGLQVSLSPASASLWLNAEAATSALAGVMPASSSFRIMYAGDNWDGNLAHLMVHIGPAGTYTQTNFLAQREVGLSGLEGQKAHERLRTIATYAGVANAELDLQRSSTVLPRASLAGQRPGAQMRLAAAADTGPLFTNGDGEIVFQSRRHRNNV